MTSEKIVTIQRGRGAWQGPESKAPVMPSIMRHVPTVTTGNASDLISREAAMDAVTYMPDRWRKVAVDALRALPAQDQPAAPDLSCLERYGEFTDYDMDDVPYERFGPDEYGEYVRLDAIEALLASLPAAPAVKVSDVAQIAAGAARQALMDLSFEFGGAAGNLSHAYISAEPFVTNRILAALEPHA